MASSMGETGSVLRPWFSLQSSTAICTLRRGNGPWPALPCLEIGEESATQAKPESCQAAFIQQGRALTSNLQFSSLIKCNLCGLSSNEWLCHGQAVYSSFWSRQEELAAPQLLQVLEGQTPASMSCEMDRESGVV